MKTDRATLLIFAVAIEVFATERPIDQEIEFLEGSEIEMAYNHYLPAGVRETFERLAPRAQVDGIVIKIKPRDYRFGQLFFELFTLVDGIKTEHLISPEGELLATIRHIPAKSAPDAIYQTIAKLAGGRPVPLVYHWLINGAAHYEINLGGKGLFMIAADGTPLGFRQSVLKDRFTGSRNVSLQENKP